MKSEAEMIGTAIHDASRNDIRNAGFLEGASRSYAGEMALSFRQRPAPGSLGGLTDASDNA